jgi:peroxin-1
VGLLAFLHPKTLAQLGSESSRADPTIALFSQGTYNTLTPPPNPSSSSANSPPLAEPSIRVLNSATRRDAASSGVSIGPEDLFIGTSDNIPLGHVVFIALPEGLEEWDLVKYVYCQFVSSAQHI